MANTTMPAATSDNAARNAERVPSRALAGPTIRVWTSTINSPIEANRPYTVGSPTSGKRRSTSMANVASNPAKPSMAIMDSTARRRTAGPAAPHRANRPGFGTGTAGAGRPDGRRTRATAALPAARAAATKNGSSRLPSAAIDPTKGPATNPTPNAAASRPSRRGRSSGSARSATAAWPTAYDDPEAPSSTRPRKSTHNAPASPVTRLPMDDPMRAAIRTGLRPIRSESRPHSGAATTWAAENTAMTAAAIAGDAPKSSA